MVYYNMKISFYTVVLLTAASPVLSKPSGNHLRLQRSNQIDLENNFQEINDYLNNVGVGASKEDVANKLVGSAQLLLSMVKKTVKQSIKAEGKIRAETTKLMDKLIRGIDKTNKLYEKYAEPALESMLNTNVKLKTQRNKLNEVVLRLQKALKSLKAIAISIFNGEITDDDTLDIVIAHQVTIMRDLIVETESIIDGVNVVYSGIYETFAEVRRHLMSYKSEIQKILDSARQASKDRDKVVEISRASVYTGCTISAINCGFADLIFLGACSAINLAVCTSLIASMEISVAATNPYYEELLTSTSRALTIASQIQDEQKSLEEYLNRETKALRNLDTSLATVRTNQKLSETIFKVDIPSLRQHYLETLDELEIDIQTYLDQKELD